MRRVTLVEGLARVIGDLAYDAVPGEVHDITKLHILDTLGCMLFGSRLPLARAVAELSRANPENGGYTLAGVGFAASPTEAAFANGVLAAAFELDSGGAYVHPGPCVLGSALAAAEYATQRRRARVTGRDLMLAVLVGYETTVRIAEWVGFAPERGPGWHTPAFHGAAGAAMAASSLLGLDRTTAAHALALAVDMAGGGLIHSRNDAKRIHTGRAAETGVISAVLAAQGVRGGLDILEHPRWGYYRALRYGSSVTTDPTEDPNTERLTADLCSRFIAYERLAFKYYPFHSVCQSVIDSATGLRKREGLDPADVARITVHVTSYVHEHEAMLQPAAELASANFSIPYAVALATVRDVPRLTEPHGNVSVFLNGFNDPLVRDLQQRVVCRSSGDLDRENPYSFDTIVELQLASGKQLVSRTQYGARARATGSLGAIAFDEVHRHHVETKFAKLCVDVIPEDVAAAISATVMSLERLDDVVEFLTMLRPSHRAVMSGEKVPA